MYCQLFIHIFCFVLFYCCGDPRDLHSFPTRRSSDLVVALGANGDVLMGECKWGGVTQADLTRLQQRAERLDRKSTRLNSSHSQISYAVFCLKKKKKNT